MARINLLPWRAERRKARLQEFYTLLGFAALVAAMISVLIVFYYSGQVEGQNNRNTYLQNQITEVDKQIAEIAELDKKKARLLKRKEVIEQLQSSRSQMVHLFDELVRTIPDGLRLNTIQQNGDQLTLEGYAQSNARVSTYMRNLQASGWMTQPDLTVIEAKGTDKGLPYNFSLKVVLTTPDAANAAAAGTTPDAAAAGAPAASASAAKPAPATVPASVPSAPAMTPTPTPTAPGGAAAKPAPAAPAPGGSP
ncbi:MAG TPA: PilN domain-containing protein [Arenimonas sp.]|uniref:PilN domain-containing protein n=1 Tax=Arenimonas sp. TaxID=1872635 RepID=UPI002CE8106D|nr:PilN domain-containing protein [Arenimonas sp.]HMB57796.1 PilN domain-containing protein [Arenimonas sp.]